MKRCPQCNRFESDEALKFCRVDGATLVSDSSSFKSEAGTAQLGASPDGVEVHTRILPHNTNANVNRATAPTTVLPPQPASIATSELSKPKGRQTSIIIAVIVTAVVAAVSAVVVDSYRSRNSAKSIQSIAVLPFENKSTDADTDYLSDGLAESLIFRLSQLSGLKVSPATSAMRYKGKDKDIAKIASELGVEAVMTGRLLKRGDNLNITVELIDIRNNKSLWGEQYERKMSELLTTQREIAAEITNKLRLKLSGEGEQKLAKKYTDNNEAYQLYLKGRFHFERRTKADMERSVELFRQATEIDPNFALAYVGIAESYASMPSYQYISPKEASPHARAAIARALELDPELPEGHAVAGMIATSVEWDYAKAEREYKKAVELGPSLAITHYRYGWTYLSAVGRHDEAIAEMKRAMDLEPLAVQQGANYAGVLVYARHFDEALEQARKTYQLDPNHIGADAWLCHSLNAKGFYSEALAVGEKVGAENSSIFGCVGIAHARTGQPEKAREIIANAKQAAKSTYVASYWTAAIYAALGDNDKAFAELETSFQNRDWFLTRLKVDPFMDPLRDDARFNDLVKRIGLPQ